MIRFICGCTSKISVLPLTEEIFKTFDSVVLDAEGFMVCQIHHQRRQGWRSLPTQPQAVANDDGEVSSMELCDYSMACFTPLEIERLIFWGEVPKPRVVNLGPSVADMRDNRDPEQVGYDHAKFSSRIFGEANRQLFNAAMNGQ